MASNIQVGARPSGLRARVLTASLLAPVVMLAVLLLPNGWLAGLMALFVAMGAWEWTALAGFSSRAVRGLYVAVALLCLLLLWTLVPRGIDALLLAFAALWWLALSVRLGLIRRIDPVQAREPSLLLLGLLVLCAPWLALVHLHQLPLNGPFLALGLLLLIWLADIAAYFSGRHFGRAKLSVLLSPGKTRIGVYGGLLAAAVWGALLAVLIGLPLGKGLLLVVICILTAVMSVVGDLFESLLKRRRGIKDTGSLLPGHGGMLDRIDSTTAAAPLFALGLIWLTGGP